VETCCRRKWQRSTRTVYQHDKKFNLEERPWKLKLRNWLTDSFSVKGETESTWYCGHYWPIVPAPDDRWWWLWHNWWNEDWQGKPKYLEKTCPSATLFTTNSTWLDPSSNLGRYSGKSAISRLSYGTAVKVNLPMYLHCNGSRTPWIWGSPYASMNVWALSERTKSAKIRF
jgi:hypothetical protein